MSDLTSGLQQAVENVLSSSLHPMTSTQLFSFPEVRTHAKSAVRVGDCLGTLWREGKLTRLLTATSSEFGNVTRWSYCWKSASLTLVSSLKEPKRPPGMNETDKNSTWGRYIASLKT